MSDQRLKFCQFNIDLILPLDEWAIEFNSDSIVIRSKLPMYELYHCVRSFERLSPERPGEDRVVEYVEEIRKVTPNEYDSRRKQLALEGNSSVECDAIMADEIGIPIPQDDAPKVFLEEVPNISRYQGDEFDTEALLARFIAEIDNRDVEPVIATDRKKPVAKRRYSILDMVRVAKWCRIVIPRRVADFMTWVKLEPNRGSVINFLRGLNPRTNVELTDVAKNGKVAKRDRRIREVHFRLLKGGPNLIDDIEEQANKVIQSEEAFKDKDSRERLSKKTIKDKCRQWNKEFKFENLANPTEIQSSKNNFEKRPGT